MANFKSVAQFLSMMNAFENDVDVVVDGTDTYIACVGGDIKFTPKGKEYFKDALELPMQGYCVFGEPQDYEDLDKWDEWYYENWDNEGNTQSEPYSRLRKASELFNALAGYCPSNKYEQWFEGEDAVKI